MLFKEILVNTTTKQRGFEARLKRVLFGNRSVNVKRAPRILVEKRRYYTLFVHYFIKTVGNVVFSHVWKFSGGGFKLVFCDTCISM